jgi:hypothetical protein
MSPTIIGLIGHQGVGKNYIAEKVLPNILPQENTVVLAFADHFKIDCITKYNADYDKVYGTKDFHTRKLLQTTGTENGRDKFGADIWIRTVENWIKVLHSRGVNSFIICDVRFENEAQWILDQKGTLIKIDAPQRYDARLQQETGHNIEKINEIKNHPSEKYIDDIRIQHVTVQNDPSDDVFTQLMYFFM